jgi:hypothetical protein
MPGSTALQAPPCEVDPAHEPGRLAVSAFPPNRDQPVTIRVCRECVWQLTQAMRRQRYVGITVTAPESTLLIAAPN